MAVELTCEVVAGLSSLIFGSEMMRIFGKYATLCFGSEMMHIFGQYATLCFQTAHLLNFFTFFTLCETFVDIHCGK
jgi:hypothetical protein